MIDHKADAEALMDDRDDSGKPTSSQMQALIAATLYLAEQQRIANLITVAQWNMQMILDGTGVRDGLPADLGFEFERLGSIQRAVREGLGL